jgi:short-subunit dehydrogenase
MQIAGSTVLLTGATGGIGQAIARELHKRGATLTLTGRRGEVLGELAQELSAQALPADLSEPSDVQRLIAECDSTDILIANAGLPGTGTLESFSAQEIGSILDVNLRAPIMLSHGLLPGMLERGRGHLLFISSLSGKVANARSALYNATKFGLRGFASALRADLHASPVGVSCVFPGFIRDAGIFAESGTKLPFGVGTRTPEAVAVAVVSAIERDRGEVDVAPLTLRVGAIMGGVAPELAATFTRLTGGEKIAESIERGSREKR